MYSRWDHLNEHLKKKHNVDGVKLQKNFNCPFCKLEPFRTRIDLLSHCRDVHKRYVHSYVVLWEC